MTMTTTVVRTLCVLLVVAATRTHHVVQARPVVRNIRSMHEFDRLLDKHATETGLPVIVDFYSDSCGPCRQMAPIFKKVAALYSTMAVFVKVDTAAQHELSSRYSVRSLPTFSFFVNGKKVDQAVGGIGEAGLKQHVDSMVRQATAENVVLTLEALTTYYATADATKSETDVAAVYNKCAGMNSKKKKKTAESAAAASCVGASANQLARKLQKKYGSKPALTKRFITGESKSSSDSDNDTKASKPKQQHKAQPTSIPTTDASSSRTSTSTTQQLLESASKQELLDELERRLDQERDKQVESEDANEDEMDADFAPWVRNNPHYPERLIVIGGGPAGMAAAIYAARAGLQPLVIAPTMGGQLQGKGVDVENYPGLMNLTGPALVAAMRKQAAHYGAVFEDDIVESVETNNGNNGQPLKVVTNRTGTIETHTIIVATGAESNWLNVPGEWELRGGGVSSCATCDGFLYAGKHVLVVGGGDTAMEDALVLARTSKRVTVVHRRDSFRASKVLSDRVLDHALIRVVWNTTLNEVVGVELPAEGGGDNVDLDAVQPKVVSGVVLTDTTTGATSRMDCDAVFVAIGHTPSTTFLQGIVEFNPTHAGYIQTFEGTTHTSVAGIFAAGDVTDAVYRQAVTSAGSGAAAALDAERYLSEHGLGNEAAELEAALLEELQQEQPTADSYNAYDDAGGRMEGMKESTMAGEL